MRTAAATLVLGVMGAVLSPGSAHAAPTITDFATCNAEAEDRTAANAPSALPRETRLDAPAESAGMTRERSRGGTDQSGTIITNPANPQFEGMSAARGSDPEYRTAYQTCMRRRGF